MIQVVANVGLGDNFASRPTVAALLRKHGEIALTTPYPQVFGDMRGILFMKPSNLNIRCAKRNADAYPWTEGAVTISGKTQLGYSLHKGCKSIPEQIAESAGLETTSRFLPDDPKAYFGDFFMDENQFAANVRKRIHPGPLGVFRIPTIRTEYKNSARNPEPGLVAAAVDEIGGDFIHLNDAARKEEVRHHDESWPMQVNYAHADAGELSIPTCLDLVSRARCVVTPVSWMLWSAIAYGTPTLCTWGGYCGPETILGPIRELASNLVIVQPKYQCCCFQPDHQCDKSTDIDALRQAARSFR